MKLIIIRRIGKHCLKCEHHNKAKDGRHYCKFTWRGETIFNWLQKQKLSKKSPELCTYYEENK